MNTQDKASSWLTKKWQDLVDASDILNAIEHFDLGARLLQYSEEALQSEANESKTSSQQEPVALTEAVAIVLEGFNIPSDVRKILETAYYTNPHQDGTSPSEARDKEFVTLTEDEIAKCFDEVMIVDEISSEFTPINFARAIEQELKAKNER